MKPIVVVVVLILCLVLMGFLFVGFANQADYQFTYTDVSEIEYALAGNPVYDFEKPIKQFGNFFNSIGDFFKDVFELFDTTPQHYRFYKLTYRFTISSDPNTYRYFSILVYADADDPDGDQQFEHTYKMFRVYAYSGDVTFLSFMNTYDYLFIYNANSPWYIFWDSSNAVNFDQKFVYQWLVSNDPPTPRADITTYYNVVTFSGIEVQRFVMNDFSSEWILVGG